VSTFIEPVSEVLYIASTEDAGILESLEDPIGVTLSNSIEHIEWDLIDDGHSEGTIRKFGATYS
jgi:hypothetical protein